MSKVKIEREDDTASKFKNQQHGGTIEVTINGTDKKNAKAIMQHSESYQNLVNSNALTQTIELCEAFVIIGVHEQTLKKAFVDLGSGLLHEQMEKAKQDIEDEEGLEESRMHMDSEHHLPCAAQILDSYPCIITDGNTFEPIMSFKSEIQAKLLGMIKEQYLYLSNIQLICFPDGYKVDIEFTKHKLLELCGRASHAYHTRTDSQQTKIIHYTITQSSGEKKYLTSIQYKVGQNSQHSQELALVDFNIGSYKETKLCFIPKSLCLMLECIFNDIVKRYHLAFLNEYQDNDDFLQIRQKLEKARAQVKIERLEFYISTFFHHLKIDGSNLEIEIYKKRSIEDSPGNDADQEKKVLIRYVNTFNKECLKLENYDFRLLFQKVKPKMLMQMFVSLLHERKIILIHNESSKNAILIEALISLLYPLQWNFTNISYLIPSMVEYLEAPFPYIVGLPRDLWKYIYEQKWDILGDEVVAFDIDNNRTYEKEELPEFPQPYTQLLIKQLEIQLDKSKQVSSRVNGVKSEETRREEDKFWSNFTLKVKQQFLNFLIFLINTFENFYVAGKDESPSKNPANQTIGGQGTAASTIDSSRVANNIGNGGSANDIFNFEEYVQNVRENQSFFEKFVRTQAFINFIEQAYYEEQGNLNDASIRFFKECTRKLSKESIQAVRAMQDIMISGLMHKFNNRGISYSIDKCHLIYEKSLQMAGKSFTPTASGSIGLISTLNHERILRLQPFDPSVLIEKRFSKVETLYDVKNMEKQKNQKKPSKHYQEFMSELQIEEPPTYAMKVNQVQLSDYYTVQAPPLNSSSLPSELHPHTLNKTANLIKIEDDYENASDSRTLVNDELIEEMSNENSSDREQEPGFLGFFKKTFSSVKKTFEQTFNNKRSNGAVPTQKRRPAISQHSVSRQGAFTPSLMPPILEGQQESPTLVRKNPKLSQQQSRTIRSQTFHEQTRPEVPQTRDRKNNNSFFQNLLNIGSGNKKEQQVEQSGSKQDELVVTQLKQKHNLNASGFFIFNDEDLKNMTEMSPQNLYKKSSTTINNQQPNHINFDFNLVETQLSHRQQPTIKAPPILDGNQKNFANRIRSISYQNQTRQQLTMQSAQKQRLMDLINESVNTSIVEETQQLYQTHEGGNRLTFALNSASSPLPRHTSRNQEGNELSLTQQILFHDLNLECLRSQRETPLVSNQHSAAKEQIKQEFEQLYKKSTENLFIIPPDRNLENGYKEKYNIWKSHSQRIHLLNNTQNAQKPPKHQQRQRPLHGLKQQDQKLGSKQMISPKLNRLQQQQPQEDILMKQKSVNSDACNERNSTDEDHKAPIMGNKHENQFKNIMKPFDKQNLISGGTTELQKGGKKQQNNSLSIQSAMNRHKRQMYSGIANAVVKGEIVNSPLHENIEPEDDTKQYQGSKQIESLQIGRVRKKSGNKTAGKQGSNSTSNMPKKQSALLGAHTSKLKPSGSKSTLKPKVQAKPTIPQAQITLSTVMGKGNKQTAQQVDYKTLKAKTIQSSEYSSCQSSQISSSQHDSIAAVNTSKIEIQKYMMGSEEYKNDKHGFMLSKEDSDFKTVNNDESYISSNSYQELKTQTKAEINLIKQSLDLRDTKKGELLRLQSQAMVVSPANSQALRLPKMMSEFQKTPQTVAFSQQQSKTPNQGMRVHSLSQYDHSSMDRNLLGLPSSLIPPQQSQILKNPYTRPNPNKMGHNDEIMSSNEINMRSGDSNQKPLSEINNQYSLMSSSLTISNSKIRIGTIQNTLKPLNKITFEAFNQIAKLSGDVDNEPHTPKSGGVGNMSDCDDIDE